MQQRSANHCHRSNSNDIRPTEESSFQKCLRLKRRSNQLPLEEELEASNISYVSTSSSSDQKQTTGILFKFAVDTVAEVVGSEEIYMYGLQNMPAHDLAAKAAGSS